MIKFKKEKENQNIKSPVEEELTAETKVFSHDKNTARKQIEKAKKNPASLVLLVGPSEFIGLYWFISQTRCCGGAFKASFGYSYTPYKYQ